MLGLFNKLNESKKTSKELPPVAQMFSSLATKEKDIWINEILGAYDIWLFYSKYEHLGVNSYDLTRNLPEQEVSKRLQDILRKTSLLVASCLDMLKEEIGPVMDIYKNLFKLKNA